MEKITGTTRSKNPHFNQPSLQPQARFPPHLLHPPDSNMPFLLDFSPRLPGPYTLDIVLLLLLTHFMSLSPLSKLKFHAVSQDFSILALLTFWAE